ncbi:MAG: aldehyde dehydrogenase family protein, partial [Treponema sp.]|nr:aldehyde dehydrogenase family protein [Treponema sp.]
MEIADLVERSRVTQKVIAGYPQEKIDSIVKVLARVVYDNAEPLAKLAVEESRMGVYEDKVAKNKGKARILWHGLKGKKSVGILEHDKAAGITIVAKPMGVIGAATPCTNPVVTPLCNAMFAVKGGNSIIIAPHPRGKKVAKQLAELFYREFDKLGVPRDVFLVIEEPTIELTNEMMKAVDVVIATGGVAMVESAYSSGKPCFGVGPGNVQGLVDNDVDFEEAAKKMIASRIFDNGIICSGTQTIIASKKNFKNVVDAFVKNGACYIDDPAKIDAFRRAVFPAGRVNKDCVGQSIGMVAKLAGVEIPQETKLVILKPAKYGKGEDLSGEKMCPLMTAYEYDTWEHAVQIACENLVYEGAGHSVDVQSNNREHIEYVGLKLPVSRILVNQICATQNGGAFSNSLSPRRLWAAGAGEIILSVKTFHIIICSINPELPLSKKIGGSRRTMKYGPNGGGFMKLLEYQAKDIIDKFGIQTMKGTVIEKAETAAAAIKDAKLLYPLVIKAQVQTGGRGKAGGVRIAENADEAENLCKQMLGMNIRGLKANQLMIVEKANPIMEWYTAIMLDRLSKAPLLIFSPMGGMDIEETAHANPDKIAKIPLDPFRGVEDYVIEYAFDKTGADKRYKAALQDIAKKLFTMFFRYYTMLVEINPLVIDKRGVLIALDAKVEIDDNAVPFLPDIIRCREKIQEDPQVMEARNVNFHFVPMEDDGTIGVMSNGSGMLMSCIDLISKKGMKTHAALDLGGGATAERIAKAVQIMLNRPKIDTIFICIFGGITRCDEVAKGACAAMEQIKNSGKKMILRIEGTN